MTLNFDQWVWCVQLLRSTYRQGFTLDETDINVWFELLADLPGENVMAAVKKVCQKVTAFPSVAAIRQFAQEPEITAAEAWEEVMRAVKSGDGLYPTYRPAGPPRSGHLEQTSWSHPAITRALLGVDGLRAIAVAEPGALPTIRAQFIRLFDMHAASHAIRRDLPELEPPQEPRALPGGVIGPVDLGAAVHAIAKPMLGESA